jgi:hypothetical protein
MALDDVILKVLSPRGVIKDVDDVRSVGGLASLEGKKVGILDNTKSGGNELLPFVKEAISNKIKNVEMKTWKVPFGLSQEIKDPRLREIADYADGVIALMGD